METWSLCTPSTRASVEPNRRLLDAQDFKIIDFFTRSGSATSRRRRLTVAIPPTCRFSTLIRRMIFSELKWSMTSGAASTRADLRLQEKTDCELKKQKPGLIRADGPVC